MEPTPAFVSILETVTLAHAALFNPKQPFDGLSDPRYMFALGFYLGSLHRLRDALETEMERTDLYPPGYVIAAPSS